MRAITRILHMIEVIRRAGLVNVLRCKLLELSKTVRWHVLKRKHPEGYCIRDVQGSKMYFSLEDPGISRDLLLDGIREPEETRIMQTVLEPSMIVVDVGANIGYYSLMECRAVTEAGHVYAIEPEPHNYATLCRNIILNNYRNIDTFEIGISDSSGSSTLYVSKHSNLHNLVTPLHPKSPGSIITIPVCSLDDFVRENGIAPSTINCIRMDIEGYETKALAGMTEILQATHSLILFVEWHPQFIKKIPGCSVKSAMDRLESYGFKVKYATATRANGHRIHFSDMRIREFTEEPTIKQIIDDDRVSTTNVFMTFLSNS